MTLTWSTACLDWERRIVAGEPLITVGALFPDEAAQAMAVFKSLRIVEAAGMPTFGEAGDQWVFDFVEAIFGAYDHSTGRREISEFFLCVAKKNGKSLISAGIMLTALIRNWRPSNELIIIAPTIKAAQNAFKPAADMVRADPTLNAEEQGFLKIQDHLRTITHERTKATLRILSADGSIVVGNKAGFVLIDELWEFGSRAKADSMLKEATGGLVGRPEGFVISISTMADAPPTGVFKDRLNYARGVRDGTIQDRKFLPVIYEFPAAMIADKSYEKPENFYITNPFVGRTQWGREWIVDGLEKEKRKGPETRNVFLAKFLNVEIGQGLRTDNWAGALFWAKRAEPGLTIEALIERCDVAVVGVDGGGLDDLLGLCVLGREKETRRWLVWCKAWAHRIVLERRKEIASKLIDLAQSATLVIVEDESSADVEELADIVEQVRNAGLLPAEAAIGADPAGVSDIVDELERRNFSVGKDGEIGEIISVPQGYKLQTAVKVAERRLAQGTMIHDGSDLMTWCVGNAKVEQKGNALMVTKQIAGTAKIDPVMAMFNAVTLMSMNPESASSSVYMTSERPDGFLFV